jgi:hypothetical protein
LKIKTAINKLDAKSRKELFSQIERAEIKKNYAKSPAEMFELKPTKELSSGSIFLWGILLHYQSRKLIDKKVIPFATNEFIMEKIGCGENLATKMIKQLRNAGLIYVFYEGYGKGFVRKYVILNSHIEQFRKLKEDQELSKILEDTNKAAEKHFFGFCGDSKTEEVAEEEFLGTREKAIKLNAEIEEKTTGENIDENENYPRCDLNRIKVCLNKDNVRSENIRSNCKSLEFKSQEEEEEEKTAIVAEDGCVEEDSYDDEDDEDSYYQSVVETAENIQAFREDPTETLVEYPNLTRIGGKTLLERYIPENIDLNQADQPKLVCLKKLIMGERLSQSQIDTIIRLFLFNFGIVDRLYLMRIIKNDGSVFKFRKENIHRLAQKYNIDDHERTMAELYGFSC